MGEWERTGSKIQDWVKHRPLRSEEKRVKTVGYRLIGARRVQEGRYSRWKAGWKGDIAGRMDGWMGIGQ